MWTYLTNNPKSTSLGAGAVLVLVASYLGILTHDQASMAVIAILATLGIVAKDG